MYFVNMFEESCPPCNDGSNVGPEISCMWKLHYENTLIQYTVIFYGCKTDYFQMKNCDIFLIFAVLTSTHNL